MRKEIEGFVKNTLVDTYGGNFTYELQVDRESFEDLIREFKDRRVKIVIEECEKATCNICENDVYVEEFRTCENCYNDYCSDCLDFSVCKNCNTEE